jgi:hypothetical protein
MDGVKMFTDIDTFIKEASVGDFIKVRRASDIRFIKGHSDRQYSVQLIPTGFIITLKSQ